MTTSRKPGEEVRTEAQGLADKIGAPLLPRESFSLAKMFEMSGSGEAIIVGPGGARWQDAGGKEFFFHPNMAAVRVKELSRGGTDALVEAAGIQSGDRVLDCTLGLGSDAIVAAHVVGETGKVTGLESQPVIAALVAHGLTTYRSDSPRLKRAMRRVRVHCADYREVLSSCPDDAYDIVFFDPMFRYTVSRSSGVQALKTLANPAPLGPSSVAEAKRVARRRVILKERKMSGEFERLGFRVVKEASNHAFGVLDCGR
ncbi:class I SAM-dependent methyltransferase [Salinithrix halophila]|uniref:Class I SAM-dependent methyltransferase n=1 Tax=Salinithrix halophila TaxID=1485204 RepID=A0ABV8JME8_9BACL